MKRIGLAVAIVTAFAGLFSHALAQSDARRSIESVGQKFSAAFQSGDVATVASFYTEDGETYPPNGDVVHGRDAIQKMWQSVLSTGTASMKLATREVESSGDLAWESGTYELFAKDGASLDRGKYIVVWKRAQGQWRLHRDIWNSSLPAKQ